MDDIGSDAAQQQDSIERLCSAVQAGKIKEAERLLQRSPELANARHPRPPRWTALMLAVWQDSEEACRLLLSSGAQLQHEQADASCLHVAAQQDSRRCARLLVDSCGGNRRLLDARDRRRRTPLILCAWHNRLDIGRLLLQAGAHPDCAEVDGFSALHFCAQRGHREFAAMLLDAAASADLSTCDTRGRHTPFTLAVVTKQLQVLELLCQQGADVWHRSCRGHALAIAQASGDSRLLHEVQDLLSPPAQPAQPAAQAGDGGGLTADAVTVSRPQLPGNEVARATVAVAPIVGSEYSLQRKGLCVVVNVKEFLGQPGWRRSRSELDVQEVVRLFGEELGFRVSLHENVDAAELVGLLSSLAAPQRHEQYDAFVCFAMSHGAEGDCLLAADCRPVHLRDVYEPFHACESLLNKPKLFFVQACRPDGPPATPPTLAGDSERQRKTDTLVAWSAAQGGRAYAADTGSLFVQTLCRVIRRRRLTHPLQAMLQIVRKELAAAAGDSCLQSTEELNRLQADVWLR